MTFQPPPNPVNYYAPPPNLNPRPTSVTVIAILGIIFGGLATICTPFSILSFFVQIGGPNPMIDEMKADKTLLAIQIVANVIGWILGILLLAGSIGALKLRRWAPPLMNTYAIGTLVMTVVGMVVHFTLMQPVMDRAFAKFPNGAALRSMANIGTLVGVLIGSALPILVLIYMNRSIAKQAFARGGQMGPGQPPQDQYYR